ncbi:ATP-binding protein [Roseinatronobacter alkalisoli]|uniref:ATP-binding protein n=1 Tax=Roseinatronobacter alkalisoli TaxID=3028235 RepID=A0ABT5TCF7_9RHOB|nr:ATP-binding protein [Roseinatronobacter sp. HJB301]MDD7971852.1 ATP-binding protein [Roseinatronobacter sp. HJB301]
MDTIRMLVLEDESSLPRFRALLEEVDIFLRSNPVHAQVHDDLTLVLAEALSNIARHGYGDCHGRVCLQLSVSDCGVVCMLRDYGAAFDPATLGNTLPAPDSLSEGGYGWFLIRALTRDLTYTRMGEQNILQFRIAGQRAGDVNCQSCSQNA